MNVSTMYYLSSLSSVSYYPPLPALPPPCQAEFINSYTREVTSRGGGRCVNLQKNKKTKKKKKRQTDRQKRAVEHTQKKKGEISVDEKKKDKLRHIYLHYLLGEQVICIYI